MTLALATAIDPRRIAIACGVALIALVGSNIATATEWAPTTAPEHVVIVSSTSIEPGSVESPFELTATNAGTENAEFTTPPPGDAHGVAVDRGTYDGTAWHVENLAPDTTATMRGILSR